MNNKCCRICNHFRKGECLKIQDIVKVNVNSNDEEFKYNIEEGILSGILEDILGDKLDPIKYVNLYEELQDKIYDLSISDSRNIEIVLQDIRSFHCSFFE